MTVLGIDLRMAQVEAERDLTDLCVITRTVSRVWDENLGEYVETTAELWRGKSRIKQYSSAGTVKDSSGELITVLIPVLQIPVSATGIEIGDIVKILSAISDADLVGNEYTITAPFKASQTSLKRFRIQDVNHVD